ncbi:GtrA family protein [Massilia brevitalea]|uniref:GtrA family protein n=1 Tax=Massilia brevitalea TaxID=442526 RepID=UPI00273A02C6|nr:GtrA family protein [Massilia brevitalea]
MSRQFLVFLLTGGTAAAVNFGSRILYNTWMSFSASIVLAYLTGMVTAFVLARMFVFSRPSHGTGKAILLFTAVNLVAVLQTWLISLGMLHFLLPALGVTRHAPELAHAVGVMAPVFTSYLGHKHFTFR